MEYGKEPSSEFNEKFTTAMMFILVAASEGLTAGNQNQLGARGRRQDEVPGSA